MLLAPNMALPFARRSRPWRSWIAALQRWRARRRAERAAIALVSAMSDRELKDIGLVRSQIEIAVRIGNGRDAFDTRR
jgi:uncharacterized protein YjiS (DUF1127 family)